MPVDRWDEGEDEQVEVNQRALIDKVLARYAAPFSVFRELLQNSDDARATAVEIHFETKAFLDRKSQADASGSTGAHVETDSDGASEDTASTDTRAPLPDLKTTVVHKWTFKNNGIVFRDEDWNRLKKIADGNPDEDKIGAFGVGFYSLFSETDEPRVMSGDKGMRFHYKDGGDQLHVRRRTLDASEHSPWTSFELYLRAPKPLPAPLDFARFLASSLTFMAHLSAVSVHLDAHRLVHVGKAGGAPRALGLLEGLEGRSPRGMMRVLATSATPLHLTAEVMHGVYAVGSSAPKPDPPLATTAAAASDGKTPARSGGLLSSFWSALSQVSAGAATPARSTTPAPPPAPPKAAVDPRTVVKSEVVLSIFTAEVEVQVDRKMGAELLRATRKKPPARLKYELIYTGKAEYDASREEDAQQAGAAGGIFEGLRANIDGEGKSYIYIGHATNQTTGIGGHMSARFIPTVERDSIDLVDTHVAVWNKELLFMGGFLARSAYELELATIHTLWTGAAPTSGPGLRAPPPEIAVALRARALHALKFFTVHASTPSGVVADELRRAFFACAVPAKRPFAIMSSAGVRSAADVRLPDPQFAEFIKDLPVVPADILAGAPRMVAVLQHQPGGMLQAIAYPDVLKELRARALSEAEGVACMRWWVGEALRAAGSPELPRLRAALLDAAVLVNGGDGEILALSAVRTFVNARRVPGALIPVDGPLPPHVLPVAFGRHFKAEELAAAFPWTELTIAQWLRHVLSPAAGAPGASAEFDVTRSAAWAERVLNVLAKAWPNLAQALQDEVIGLLKGKTCVPTGAGMRAPEQAYFASVNMFPDLPIVAIPVKGALEKILLALGVRKHVELQLVFDRMIKTGDWTISDLTKYLASVQGTLSADEWERLRMTSAFPKQWPSPPDPAKRAPRFKASDLYEPVDSMRELGLPVIDWGTATKWRSNSEEAKFLQKLGLRRFPPLEVILGLAAGADAAIRPKALHFFLDNFSTRYPIYDPRNFADLAFVPAVDSGKPRMACPKEVFINSDWALLGFAVVEENIRDDALTKLKIRESPPTSALVALLERSPPKDHGTASKWFGVLASRISQFSDMELNKLARMPFVPVSAASSGEKPGAALRMLPPSQCYFLKESRQFHSKLFTSVDFGSRANGFLSACGTKEEPSVEEIALILLSNPRQFYELAEGRENFLAELRNIAVNARLISTTIITRMKRSAVLLGSRRVRKEGQSDLEEENWDFEHDLLKPDQIVIADDTNEYHLFGDSIFVCPQEDLLEGFYMGLGSRRLSSLVKEEYRTGIELKNSQVSAEVRTLVLERLPLFLHDHTHEGQRIQYDWLNQESHFVVRAFGKLSVAKSLRFGSISVSRSLDASAIAKQEGGAYGGSIQLWLAGNTQVDMFEVANSLCRLLFSTPKKNDALLFSAILSTDLLSLRRRGYNIDRILKHHMRQRAEDADRQRRSTALVSDTSSAVSTIPGSFNEPPAVPTASKPLLSEPSSNTLVDPPPARTASPAPAPSPILRDINDLKARNARPASGVMDQLQSWKRKLQRTDGSSADGSLGKGASASEGADPAGHSHGGLAPPRVPSRPDSPSPVVTPLSNIAANIDNAIKACRPETSGLLRNREQMQVVKESMNEGYCDAKDHTSELDLLGDMGGMKVYAQKGLPNAATLMMTKRDVLARFINLLQQLSGVYKLPQTSLHVFYDAAGSLIAFNRNGSLFCNLRYYEGWHDSAVQRGDFNKAYISWFFTLAHEIAHNLVQDHNSEHEFYFSALCEAHLLGFGRLLAGPS